MEEKSFGSSLVGCLVFCGLVKYIESQTLLGSFMEQSNTTFLSRGLVNKPNIEQKFTWNDQRIDPISIIQEGTLLTLDVGNVQGFTSNITVYVDVEPQQERLARAIFLMKYSNGSDALYLASGNFAAQDHIALLNNTDGFLCTAYNRNSRTNPYWLGCWKANQTTYPQNMTRNITVNETECYYAANNTTVNCSMMNNTSNGTRRRILNERRSLQESNNTSNTSNDTNATNGTNGSNDTNNTNNSSNATNNSTGPNNTILSRQVERIKPENYTINNVMPTVYYREYRVPIVGRTFLTYSEKGETTTVHNMSSNASIVNTEFAVVAQSCLNFTKFYTDTKQVIQFAWMRPVASMRYTVNELNNTDLFVIHTLENGTIVRNLTNMTIDTISAGLRWRMVNDVRAIYESFDNQIYILMSGYISRPGSPTDDPYLAECKFNTVGTYGLTACKQVGYPAACRLYDVIRRTQTSMEVICLDQAPNSVPSSFIYDRATPTTPTITSMYISTYPGHTDFNWTYGQIVYKGSDRTQMSFASLYSDGKIKSFFANPGTAPYLCPSGLLHMNATGAYILRLANQTATNHLLPMPAASTSGSETFTLTYTDGGNPTVVSLSAEFIQTGSIPINLNGVGYTEDFFTCWVGSVCEYPVGRINMRWFDSSISFANHLLESDPIALVLKRIDIFTPAVFENINLNSFDCLIGGDLIGCRNPNNRLMTYFRCQTRLLDVPYLERWHCVEYERANSWPRTFEANEFLSMFTSGTQTSLTVLRNGNPVWVSVVGQYPLMFNYTKQFPGQAIFDNSTFYNQNGFMVAVLTDASWLASLMVHNQLKDGEVTGNVAGSGGKSYPTRPAKIHVVALKPDLSEGLLVAIRWTSRFGFVIHRDKYTTLANPLSFTSLADIEYNNQDFSLQFSPAVSESTFRDRTFSCASSVGYVILLNQFKIITGTWASGNSANPYFYNEEANMVKDWNIRFTRCFTEQGYFVLYVTNNNVNTLVVLNMTSIDKIQNFYFVSQSLGSGVQEEIFTSPAAESIYISGDNFYLRLRSGFYQLNLRRQSWTFIPPQSSNGASKLTLRQTYRSRFTPTTLTADFNYKTVPEGKAVKMVFNKPKPEIYAAVIPVDSLVSLQDGPVWNLVLSDPNPNVELDPRLNCTANIPPAIDNGLALTSRQAMYPVFTMKDSSNMTAMLTPWGYNRTNVEVKLVALDSNSTNTTRFFVNISHYCNWGKFLESNSTGLWFTLLMRCSDAKTTYLYGINASLITANLTNTSAAVYAYSHFRMDLGAPWEFEQGDMDVIADTFTDVKREAKVYLQNSVSMMVTVFPFQLPLAWAGHTAPPTTISTPAKSEFGGYDFCNFVTLPNHQLYPNAYLVCANKLNGSIAFAALGDNNRTFELKVSNIKVYTMAQKVLVTAFQCFNMFTNKPNEDRAVRCFIGTPTEVIMIDLLPKESVTLITYTTAPVQQNPRRYILTSDFRAVSFAATQHFIGVLGVRSRYSVDSKFTRDAQYTYTSAILIYHIDSQNTVGFTNTTSSPHLYAGQVLTSANTGSSPLVQSKIYSSMVVIPAAGTRVIDTHENYFHVQLPSREIRTFKVQALQLRMVLTYPFLDGYITGTRITYDPNNPLGIEKLNLIGLQNITQRQQNNSANTNQQTNNGRFSMT